jgi:hypothetical protein
MTVVYDLANALGKEFTIAADGTLTKKAAVSTSWAAAITLHVPNAAAMKRLLEVVGDCPYAALINAGFPAVPVGTEFRIASRRELRRILGSQIDPDAVHTWKGMVLVARIKERTTPSTWQLIDRDVDSFTPQAMRVDYDEWLAICDRILPGLANTTRVVMPSSSARVLRDGVPFGSSNGHTWVRIRAAADVNRAKAAILARSITQEVAWLKPRFSRTTGERLNGRGMWCCPLDTAVWTQGRLCFDGRPVLGEGLTLAPLDVQIVEGEQEVLDTSAATFDSVAVLKASRAKGTAVRIKQDGNTATVLVENLEMETQVELEDGAMTTVAALTATTQTDAKVRCQSPFRASESMAAFFAVNKWGQPRVYDVGTGTLHVLKRDELPGHTSTIGAFVNRCVAAISSKFGGDWDAAELAVNAEALVAIITQTSWLPDRGKVSLFNDLGGLITLTEKEYRVFGQKRTFDAWIDLPAIRPWLMSWDARLMAANPDADPGEGMGNNMIEWLEEYELNAVLTELKLHRQVAERRIAVDMFAPRASMEFDGDRQAVVLPFKRLRCHTLLSECTEDVIDAVSEDYLAHWSMLPQWLDCLVASRFATDRRKAFQWLHAPASWGKGFLTELLRTHGLLFNVSVKEVDLALEGKPVGLSANDTITSWILFVDEWKSVTREIKELNRQLTLSSKNQLRTTIPLYLKLFASAESVNSLVQGGVESQFAERFSLLAPATKGKLDDRPAMLKYGKALYFEAMVVYLGREIMRRVDAYLDLGFKQASDHADAALDAFHATHGMGKHFQTMDAEIERVAEGVVLSVTMYLNRQAAWAADMGHRYLHDDSCGRRLGERLKAAKWGHAVRADGVRDLALVTGNVEALIRAFLEDEGTSPSMMLKLDYKMPQIVEKISVAPDSSGKFRLYSTAEKAGRGDGSKMKTRARGRAIFADQSLIDDTDA